jgi:hypothetical protein
MCASEIVRTRRRVYMPETWRAGAFFLLLTIVLTYPLSVMPDRAMWARNPDDELFIWTLAWDAHAFLRQPLSLFDANIFAPERHTLAYSENLIGSAFIAAPVLWLTGNHVLALNAAILLSCALCGLGAYVLGRRIGLSPQAALLCGIVFAFSPARFFRNPQLHVGAVQWLPFGLASMHAYLSGREKRHLRWAAVFFSLQALTSGHGAMFSVVAIVVMLGLHVVLGDLILPFRLLKDLGIVGLALLVPAGLMYLPYRAVQIEMGLRRGLGSMDTRLEAFVASPTPVHIWLRSLLTTTDPNATAHAFLFPGVVPVVLAVLAIAWRSRRSVVARSPASDRKWIRLAFVCEIAILMAFALAMIVTLNGPLIVRYEEMRLFAARSATRAWIAVALLIGLRAVMLSRAPLNARARLSGVVKRLGAWAGRRRLDPRTYYVLLVVVCILLALPPPFGIWSYVYWLPGFSFIRATTRIMVLGTLGFAVLAGLGFDRMTPTLTGTKRHILVGFLGALLVCEFAAIPLRPTPFRVEIPQSDQWLARQPKPFTVVELPVAPNVRYQTTYMLHSMAHWQKTVHGYSGFEPASHTLLYARLRGFPSEISLEHLLEYGVTYAVVHIDMYPPAEWETVEQKLHSFTPWLTLEYTDDRSRVYSVRRP